MVNMLENQLEPFKEHLKAPSPVYGHQTTAGHKTSVGNLRIVDREGSPEL